MTLFGYTPSEIEALFFIFARLVAICFTAPVLSSQRVPVHIRAGLCVLMTFMLQPLVAPAGLGVSPTLFHFAFMVMREAVVGAVIGYSANLIFSVAQMAGEMQDTQAGFGFAGVVDPNVDRSSAILGQLQMMLMWLIFMVLNGHHVMLKAVADSFYAIPLGTFAFNGGLSTAMVSIVAQLLMIAIRVGAPVIGSVLLTDIAMGMLQRTSPQLNLMAVGFQVKIGLASAAVLLALPFMATQFRDLIPFMDNIVRTVFANGR